MNKYKDDWWKNYLKVETLEKENLKRKVENKNLEKELNNFKRYKSLYDQQEEIINSNPELKKMYLEKLPVEEKNKNKRYSMSL